MNLIYYDFNIVVILILPKEFASLHKDCSMLYDFHWEDHYHPDMESKVMLIQNTTWKRLHHDVGYIEPPFGETKFHLSPLMLESINIHTSIYIYIYIYIIITLKEFHPLIPYNMATTMFTVFYVF